MMLHEEGGDGWPGQEGYEPDFRPDKGMQQMARNIVAGFVAFTPTSLFGMALQLPPNVFVRLCFLNDAIASIRTMHRVWTL